MKRLLFYFTSFKYDYLLADDEGVVPGCIDLM